MYNRNTQIDLWYQRYIYVLGQIGMTTDSFDFGTVTQLETTVHATVCRLVGNIVDGAKHALVKKIASALGNDVNVSALNFLNKKAGKGSNTGGNFQVSAAGTTSLDLKIVIGYYYYTEDIQVTNVFFHKFTHMKTQFKQASNTYTLPRVIADRLRDYLTQVLGDRIRANICQIAI